MLKYPKFNFETEDEVRYQADMETGILRVIRLPESEEDNGGETDLNNQGFDFWLSLTAAMGLMNLAVIDVMNLDAMDALDEEGEQDAKGRQAAK